MTVLGFVTLSMVCGMAAVAFLREKQKPTEDLDDPIHKLYEVLARAERYKPENANAAHKR